ncbi:hypothetical protein HY642_03685 [Candidatus Woesearchaeota archaeon]|nr:hypothetical protein [Candidatus Woesearchaeota archaeon]
MEIQEVVHSVESSGIYGAFRQRHSNAFLAHALVLFHDDSQQWHLGYFDREQAAMTTFIVARGEIDAVEDRDILRSENEIAPLDISLIKMTSEQALNAARDAARASYPREQVIKTFFVIQVIDSKPVFNVTFFTAAFSTINIRLSCAGGNVLSHTCERIFTPA